MVGVSSQDFDERVALAWLVFAAGRKRARRLLAEEGSPRAALPRLGRRTSEFAHFLSSLENHPGRLVVPDDPEFAPLLREIPDPPLLLYCSGSTELLKRSAVAVVGARRCSRLGAETARSIARDLAALGFTVVSGLATGIDAAAHRGALLTGQTVAILGAGLARIYPASHRPLADEILESGGLVVSEYPHFVSAKKHQFPERNRLISGLSLGVLVVEAGEESGSLITARLALEQGRDVMAIPGSINNPAARGCHRLLRQGAALVENVADVVEVLGLVPGGIRPQAGAPPAPLAPADRELATFLGLLDSEITTFDQLCAGSSETPQAIAAKLIELELAGFVEQVSGGYIRRPFRGS